MGTKNIKLKQWVGTRKVLSTELVGSQYNEFMKGDIPQMESMLDCGHAIRYGTTGILFEFMNCDICDRTDDTHSFNPV